MSKNTRRGTKGFVTIPLAERFWAKVTVRRGQCWPWRGAGKSREYPYGMIWDAGKNRQATHVSWELHHGRPFPDGMFACHHCDNPNCVNPEHIFVGTMEDNSRDCAAKGRNARIGYSRRTHCIRGHAFTPDNTHLRPNGHRVCRECHRLLDAQYKARNRARRALEER